MMDGEVPAGGAAHREAADGDAVVVDGVVLLDAVHRLESVDFAGELVGAAVAAVEAQDEGALRREIGVDFWQPSMKFSSVRFSPRPWHQRSRRCLSGESGL